MNPHKPSHNSAPPSPAAPNLAALTVDQLAQASHEAVNRDDWAALLPLAQQWFARQPKSEIANYYLGLAHAMHQRWGMALVYLQRALELRPYIAPAQFHLGRVWQHLGRHAEAIAALRWCVLLSPQHSNAHALLGDSLSATGQFTAAAQHYQTVQALVPHWAGLNLVIAQTWLNARQTDAAAPYFEAALREVQADSAQTAHVQWEYAMQLLMQEQFQRGWQYHEARLTKMGWEPLHLCPLPMPAWAGEPLAGKTIVVHGEQGIGDEMMFASIVPELIAQAAQVVIACYPNLVTLYRSSFPAAMVVAHPRGTPAQWHQQLPAWIGEVTAQLQTRRAQGQPISGAIDLQCATGSLALHTRRAVGDFPAQAFFQIDADRRAKMQALLAQPTRSAPPLRIGVAWAGNLSNPTAALRSVDLAQLLPLRVAFPEAVFVSLQSREHAAQAGAQPQMRLVDVSQHTDDFADLGALMLQLDCIVTVDTAFVHLAGGLGCPTYLLQSFRGEWRWGEAGKRQQALWYPKVHIMRQVSPGDWASAVQATIAAIRQLPAQL